MSRLFVAADDLARDPKRGLEVLNQLAETGEDFGIKVNLDLMLEHGYCRALEMVASFNRDIFVDLKMWNGRRTMVRVAKALMDLGVNYFNVYALAEKELETVVEAIRGSQTKLLAVTVLTHYRPDYCRHHFNSPLPLTVRHLTEVAVKVGCDGVILPGTTLATVSDIQTTKVVPGIRFREAKDEFQNQDVEPSEVVSGGGDWGVVGSPIMKADNPVEALKRFNAALGLKSAA